MPIINIIYRQAKEMWAGIDTRHEGGYTAMGGSPSVHERLRHAATLAGYVRQAVSWQRGDVCVGMKKKGFTLIELLVVIAIIAILAAILFPIFVRVQQSARLTKCLDNIKQISGACTLYEGDYDGGMVMGFAGGGVWGDWYEMTNIYLKQMYKKASDSYALRGVWLCPNMPYSKMSSSGNEIDVNVKRCYGYNYAYLGGLMVSGVREWHRNSEVTKSSKTIRIMEIWGWHHKFDGSASEGWGTAYCYPPMGDPVNSAVQMAMNSAASQCKPSNCWPPGWHSASRSVVAWCDGHVSTFTAVAPMSGTSFPPNTYTGRTNLLERTFNDDGVATHCNPYFRLKAPKP